MRTEQYVLEGNKLIAEFMGLEVTPNGKWQSKHDGIHNIQYNSSWDWLRPVVEKIEDIEFSTIKSSYTAYTNKPFGIDINFRYAKVTVDNDFRLYNIIEAGINFNNHNCESKIEGVWLAVVEFIKWYNKQSKK